MSLRKAALALAAPVALLLCGSGAALAETAVAKGPTVLVYGNYCGFGNNAPLAPIDALDAACARNDDCTPDDALPTKACNLRLEREAGALALDPRQPDEVRMMAGLVSAFAANHQFQVVQETAPAPARMPRGAYMTLR